MRPLLVASIIVLAGCATHPVPNDRADRVEAMKYTTPLQGGGKLVVKRDTGFLGSGCRSHVYIDGEKVASLGTSDMVTLYLPAGEHMVGAMNAGFCGGGVSEAEVNLAANATKTYRIEYGDGGRITLQPTAF